MERETQQYKFWNEEDFDETLDMLAPTVATGSQSGSRQFKAWFEEWEAEAVFTRHPTAEAKLLKKYGGIQFNDTDSNKILRISETEMRWVRPGKRDRQGQRGGGWCVLCDYVEGGDTDAETFELGSGNCIYYLIRRFHKKSKVIEIDNTEYLATGDSSDEEDEEEDGNTGPTDSTIGEASG